MFISNLPTFIITGMLSVGICFTVSDIKTKENNRVLVSMTSDIEHCSDQYLPYAATHPNSVWLSAGDDQDEVNPDETIHNNSTWITETSCVLLLPT